MTPEVEFIVRLRPIGVDPAGRDVGYRLRVALKTLLRSFGLRAVAVERTGGREPGDCVTRQRDEAAPRLPTVAHCGVAT
ncbi:MAG: hypothetical protein AB1716_04220 [Planctomycetota bacterium]